MHARIYQITSKPIPEANYLTEFDFIESNFVGEVADYLDETLDRATELEALQKHLAQMLDTDFDWTDASFSISQSGKEKYFQQAFVKFKDAVEKMSKVDFKTFVNDDGVGGLLHAAKDSFSEKFADYVSSDEFETITFDDFVHCAKPDTRYYVGSILSYHY